MSQESQKNSRACGESTSQNRDERLNIQGNYGNSIGSSDNDYVFMTVDKLKNLRGSLCKPNEETFVVSLLNKVHEKGGFETVYTKNQWHSITNELGLEQNSEECFKFYRDHCMKFELYTLNKDKYDNDDSLKEDVFTFGNFGCLQYPVCCYDLQDWHERKEYYFGQSFVLLKNFEQLWNINKEIMSPSQIDKKYGDNEIDVVEQRALAYGFNYNSKDLVQKKQTYTISRYIQYQQQFMNSHLCREQNQGKLVPEKIKFGVNIDIGDWKEVNKELHAKVPAELFANSNKDLCRFLRQHIPGMTIPQIYLKVPGCWTGGHQENLNMMAININHGPGDVEWYVVDVDEAKKFRKIVKHNYGVDVSHAEGLWYIDLEFCIKNDIKVTMFVQEEGDVVSLSPGTLHWVRSHEVTVNSAWNFGEHSYNQLSRICERWKVNSDIGFRSLIPTRTFFQDLLNHDFMKFDDKAFKFLLEQGREIVNYSNKEFSDFIKWPARKSRGIPLKNDDPKNNMILVCSSCYSEIFNLWGYCNFLVEDGIYCINCFKAHVLSCKRETTHIAFQKYSNENLKLLLDIGENLRNDEVRYNYNGDVLVLALSADKQYILKNSDKNHSWKEGYLTKQYLNQEKKFKKAAGRKIQVLEGDHIKVSIQQTHDPEMRDLEKQERATDIFKREKRKKNRGQKEKCSEENNDSELFDEEDFGSDEDQAEPQISKQEKLAEQMSTSYKRRPGRPRKDISMGPMASEVVSTSNCMMLEGKSKKQKNVFSQPNVGNLLQKDRSVPAERQINQKKIDIGKDMIISEAAESDYDSDKEIFVCSRMNEEKIPGKLKNIGIDDDQGFMGNDVEVRTNENDGGDKDINECDDDLKEEYNNDEENCEDEDVLLGKRNDKKAKFDETQSVCSNASRKLKKKNLKSSKTAKSTVTKDNNVSGILPGTGVHRKKINVVKKTVNVLNLTVMREKLLEVEVVVDDEDLDFTIQKKETHMGGLDGYIGLKNEGTDEDFNVNTKDEYDNKIEDVCNEFVFNGLCDENLHEEQNWTIKGYVKQVRQADMVDKNDSDKMIKRINVFISDSATAPAIVIGSFIMEDAEKYKNFFENDKQYCFKGGSISQASDKEGSTIKYFVKFCKQTRVCEFDGNDNKDPFRNKYEVVEQNSPTRKVHPAPQLHLLQKLEEFDNMTIGTSEHHENHNQLQSEINNNNSINGNNMGANTISNETFFIKKIKGTPRKDIKDSISVSMVGGLNETTDANNNQQVQQQISEEGDMSKSVEKRKEFQELFQNNLRNILSFVDKQNKESNLVNLKVKDIEYVPFENKEEEITKCVEKTYEFIEANFSNGFDKKLRNELNKQGGCCNDYMILRKLGFLILAKMHDCFDEEIINQVNFILMIFFNKNRLLMIKKGFWLKL